MANFVEEKYVYEDTTGNITDKARGIWEQLMRCMDKDIIGLKLDELYPAKTFSEIIEAPIPSATLTALVKRGLLHCDGKVNGLNVYAITSEILEYYRGVYVPTKERYKSDLNAYFSRRG